MNKLKQNIEDLKIMRNGYPENSRGYCALNLAIATLSQIYASKEHMLSHWVVGEKAGSSQ